MSRSIIAGIVAAAIAALAATAYFVTTSSQADKVEREQRDRVDRARRVVQQSSAIEGLNALHNIELLSRDPQLYDAITANTADGKRDFNRLDQLAGLSFASFVAGENQKQPPPKPDVLALTDETGGVMYLNGVAGVPTEDQFKDKDKKVTIPALAEALKDRISVCEVMPVGGDIGLARVAAAPIILVQNNPDGTSQTLTKGAVIAIYTIKATDAQKADGDFGVRVAYFDDARVSATSFSNGSGEDTEMQGKLSKALDDSGLRKKAFDDKQPDIGDLTSFDVGGTQYVGATVRLPMFVSKTLPADYPHQDAGVLVLLAPGDEASSFTRPAKTFILLLGIGAIAIALLGMYLTHRRTEAQIDEIELGVAEIINGNLDRTFRPVGSELDGLANGLNVMLARLLGRPEPGEEAFDENGNPIIPGRVDFEEATEGAGGSAAPAADPDLAALAQEPEPDYYKRVFTEYAAARKESGSPDDVSFESFIAKLRVNEGKLKAQYNCRAVRFRVVMKDGKVTLKPVPIF